MRREWMNEEMLRKMATRRRHQRNRAEYRKLEAEIRGKSSDEGKMAE